MAMPFKEIFHFGLSEIVSKNVTKLMTQFPSQVQELHDLCLFMTRSYIDSPFGTELSLIQ